MAVWRNDWERSTAGGRTWKVVGKGEDSGDDLKALVRRTSSDVPQGKLLYKKAEDGEDNAPTEVSRDDTGRGVDFGGLFDPKKSDTPGEVPSIDPLLKLQKAQVALGQQLRQVQQGIGSLQQSIMGLGAAAPEQINAIEGQIAAMCRQLGIQLPPPVSPESQGQGPPQSQPQIQPQSVPQQGMPQQGQTPEMQQGAPQTQSFTTMEPPSVGPDGLVLGDQSGPVEQTPSIPDIGSYPGDEESELREDPTTYIPKGLEFDDSDEDAYAQSPKRALPPRPGEAFSTPGSELAAGTPPVVRMETAIKTSEHRITPEELAKELTETHGHEWLDWEPETIVHAWAQEHGTLPDAETIQKIFGLQVLLVNTNGFWTDYQIFRDVVLVLNGNNPLFDTPEEESSITPGQLAYGVFVAMQLAPYETVGMQEPSEDIKMYVAKHLAEAGLIFAMFPLRWAQEALDSLVSHNALSSTGLTKEMVEQRLMEVVDTSPEEANLDQSNAVDQQVALLMAIKDYVIEMEEGT